MRTKLLLAKNDRLLGWFLAVSLVCLPLGVATVCADEPTSLPTGDEMLAAYFRHETTRLQHACLEDIDSLETWESRREQYRQQLLQMLGLDPWPQKTDLQATTTGVTEADEFRVERVHFQSMPGLYVTGNLYVPKNVTEPLPAILYVCGHAAVKLDGVSYGNKTHYQHHGAWFARHGYVCLTIDSLQLGEIESIHHGLYREGMWWWMNRGYTPAGVEAWNCVRALDYLQTRAEVDPQRLGVTGRSGGGAYSWWIAAIDDRIQTAVPVAGITDLQNHVVDGCVEGHCDCMYMVNTFQWDYPLVAALVAPRPLLISNTDRDSIFPLDGVVRLHAKVRKIYQLYGADEQLGLQITSGPHEDTQELRIHAFRWFDQHLKQTDRLIERPAVRFFEPSQLQVFASRNLPQERNTTIHESFVPATPVENAEPPLDWQHQLEQWVFRGWPEPTESLRLERIHEQTVDGIQLTIASFSSQPNVRLPIYVVQPAANVSVDRLTVRVLDEAGWQAFSAAFAPEPTDGTLPDCWRNAAKPVREQRARWLAELTQDGAPVAFVVPRGIGPTRWTADERTATHIERRFFLLGQTLDGMRIWDVRRALAAAKELQSAAPTTLTLQADRGRMAGVTLYAALFEPSVSHLHVQQLPASHRDGPFLLNVRRVWDLPQALAVAQARMQVQVKDE
jgi:dienelactone hydrolase